MATIRRSLNGRPYPSPHLVTLAVPGTKGRRLTLDEEVAPILVALAADYHRTVRPIDKGQTDEGGYADRDGRQTPGSKSNHANGSAIDLNWREEGAQGSAWGKRFFAQAKAQRAVRKILKDYAPIITWGGNWRAKDYMHFEIATGTTSAQIEAVKRRLGITSMGVRTK